MSSNGGMTRSAAGTVSPITLSGLNALTTAKTYTCTVTATNARGAGIASAPSAAVIVGSPTAPTGVTVANVASGQLKISFTAGANNGRTITSFTAACTSTNGGVSGSHAGSASPILLSGLTTAKTYTCTVTATNGRGAGLSSAPSAPIVKFGALDHLVVSPASASISAGGSQAYTAEGFDQFNNDLGDVTGASTFTIAPADGSCTGASCTATVAGAHTVTATDGTATGTATLTIS